jgi:hypothetical protein
LDGRHGLEYLLEFSIILPHKRKISVSESVFLRNNFPVVSIGRAYNIKICRIVDIYRLIIK